jgi:hypothetical protein
MQEVLFLLKNLLDREQTTVKAIVASLLDVGAIHFINDRVQIRPLRPLARPFAKISKPALVFLAHRLVQQKAPRLIANWLQRRVVLKAKRTPPPPPSPQAVREPALIYQHEIRRLRSRVNLTTGALVGVSGVLVLALVGVDLRSMNQLWQSTASEQTANLVQIHRLKPWNLESRKKPLPAP